jgi:hypothetical protein
VFTAVVPQTTIGAMNLKNSLVAFAVALSLLAAMPAAATPKELGYGIWTETYKGTYIYTVDTEAQICLAVVALSQGGGPTNIDCAKLKRRAEWKSIITWINDAAPPAAAPVPAPAK